MLTLRAIAGPYSGREFVLQDGSVEIGREPGCGLVLSEDTGVSRRHVRLDVQGDRVTATDLGSSNGVFRNGSRTASSLILPGDRLQFGNSVFTIDAPGADGQFPPAGASAQFSGVPAQGFAAPPPGFPSPTPGAAGPAAAAPPFGGLMEPMSPMGAAPGGLAAATGYPGSPPPGYGPGAAAGGYPPPGYGAYPPPNSVPYAKWLYFLGFSIPPIGVLIGLVYLLKDTPDEQKVGKWLLFWSILGGLVLWWGYVETMHLLSSLMGSHGGLLGGQDDPTGLGIDPSQVLKQAVPAPHGGLPVNLTPGR